MSSENKAIGEGPQSFKKIGVEKGKGIDSSRAKESTLPPLGLDPNAHPKANESTRFVPILQVGKDHAELRRLLAPVNDALRRLRRTYTISSLLA